MTRVTEHLKSKVKALYAPDKGGDAQLWALRPISEDARRYAALDVWLLLRIHQAMTEDQALDEAWRARVVAASAQRARRRRAELRRQVAPKGHAPHLPVRQPVSPVVLYPRRRLWT